MAARSTLMAIVGVAALLGTACGGADGPAGPPNATTTQDASSSRTTTSSVAAGTPTAANGRSACSDLGGQVGPDRVCTVHAETADYTIDMSFPSDYPDQRGVSDVLTHQRDQFLATVTEPPVSPMPKALDITSVTYRSGSPESGTESLVMQEYVNYGGAHPETYYDALTYDRGTKTPITFDTLFKAGSDPVAVLDPIVQNDLKTRLEGVSVDANPLGAKMYENFALTDDAVVFFIGQGKWTIEAAGAQEVSVPRNALASVLA